MHDLLIASPTLYRQRHDATLVCCMDCMQDVELKVAILEWFATCVDTQPGVVEVLLNINTVQDSTSGHKVCFCTKYLILTRIRLNNLNNSHLNNMTL